MLGDAVFYLMEPVDGFNAGAGCRRCTPPTPRCGTAWACRWPTPPRNWGPWITSRLAWATSASPTVSWNVKCHDGFRAGFLPEVRQLPGPDIGDVDAVAGWLRENLPSSFTPGIMHGDYHAANVMFSPTDPTWWRSSTGRCPPSATRCRTSAGCWPPGTGPATNRCCRTS